MRLFRLCVIAALFVSILATSGMAENSSVSSNSSADSTVSASPKSPWGDFKVIEKEEVKETRLTRILLWIPNRLMDLVDIVKFDVGVGPSVGAVARVTKYANVGYRSFAPTSVRVGNFGREAPYLLERSSEFGVSPFYVPSAQRKYCKGETGAGVDILIFGAYIAVCPEEIFDFLGGIVFLDPADDDLR